jgi:hypothetical protein
MSLITGRALENGNLFLLTDRFWRPVALITRFQSGTQKQGNERLGNSPAIRLLEKLATGDPDADETADARAALARCCRPRP